MEQSPLFSFRDPPVVEVAIGLQFEPLGMGSGHLGWFWREGLGDGWPTASDAPAIPEQVESFARNTINWPPIGFQLRTSPPVRLQIQNANRDRMVQVQDTRFIYNWIKKSDSYPRYLKIREEFETLFSSFSKFTELARLARLHINQWEVSYVNHIHAGVLWETPRDVAKVFPVLAKVPDPFGPTVFETFSGEWRCEIPPKNGRLYISLQFQEVKKDSQSTDVVMVRLTARGPVSDGLEWRRGVELGHEMIVRTFVDISSVEAKRTWGEL